MPIEADDIAKAKLSRALWEADLDTKAPLRTARPWRQMCQTIYVRYALECGHEATRTHNVLNGRAPKHPARMGCNTCRETEVAAKQRAILDAEG